MDHIHEMDQQSNDSISEKLLSDRELAGMTQTQGSKEGGANTGGLRSYQSGKDLTKQFHSQNTIS
jgi:hypothetical protein